jgi:error-prone DNA polymerase
MGFYAPAQLIREARRQGVEVRAVDCRHSCWDCTLERTELGQPAIRLGLRLVKGLSANGVERLVAARDQTPFTSLADLKRRARLNRRDLDALAGADALAGLTGNRHLAAWQVAGLIEPLPLVDRNAEPEPLPMLPPPTEGEAIVADYAALGLSLRRHPLALLRERLRAERLLSAEQVHQTAPGEQVRTAGLVINRQRPAAANNVTFVTLEDETGQLNLVVFKQVAERQRTELLGARLLGIAAEVQREAGVTHLVVDRMLDYSHLLGGLVVQSRDFH